MKKNTLTRLYSRIVICIFCILLPIFTAAAQETIRYSCSAQVHEVFGNDFIASFTKETGVVVEKTVSSSNAAVRRLLSDFSDIASTTEHLSYRHREYGYVQIPFCRDPLAVIVNVDCPVGDITDEQLKGIFNKTIINWKELGGRDENIVVMIPGEKTGAYKNFDRQVMSQRELLYDFTAYRSTGVLNAVERSPAMISFIGYGTTKDHAKVKALKINGHAPEDIRYPYYQIYSFVTKGTPTGAVQKFIQFALTPKGRDVIKQKGMKPIR